MSCSRSLWNCLTSLIMSLYILSFLYIVMARSGSSTVMYNLEINMISKIRIQNKNVQSPPAVLKAINAERYTSQCLPFSFFIFSLTLQVLSLCYVEHSDIFWFHACCGQLTTNKNIVHNYFIQDT